MSDPVTNVEIEDVLSSIRRLVSNESRPSIHRPSDEKRKDTHEKLMLTPALRIAEDFPAEAEDQGDRDQADESPDATDTDEEQNATAAEDALDAVDPDVSEAQTDATDTAGAEDDVEMAVPQEKSDSAVEAQHADDSAEAIQEDRISGPARAFGLESVSRTKNDTADSVDSTADADTAERQSSGDDRGENAKGAAAGLHLLRGADDEDESDEADFQDTADIKDTDDASTAAAPADEAEVEAVEQQVEVIEVAEIAEAAPDEAPSLSEAAADLDATEASNETAEAGSVEVASDEAGADEAVLDEDALRELVGDIVRQELQGVLGERITRNIRKLVRREIHRFLAEQDID